MHGDDQGFIQAQLRPGERLRWWGRPDSRARLRQAVPWLILMLGALVVPLLLTLAFNLVFDTRLCFAGLLLFPGALAPLWQYLTGRRTLYAITDRRVLVLTAGRSGKVQALHPTAAAEIQYTPRDYGSGDLHFVAYRDDGHMRHVAFLGVSDAKRAAQLLEDLAQQA